MSDEKFKSRRVEDILSELKKTISVINGEYQPKLTFKEFDVGENKKFGFYYWENLPPVIRGDMI